MTVSFGSAATGWEEDSLLHPLTTGRTRSASAAIAATVVRGWRAGAVLVRGEGSRVKAVMTRSLIYAVLDLTATAGGGAPGQSRNRFPIAMGAMGVIAGGLGRDMGVGSVIDKGGTPPYLSQSLPAPPEAPDCPTVTHKMK